MIHHPGDEVSKGKKISISWCDSRNNKEKK
jgi:hypothetical protein